MVFDGLIDICRSDVSKQQLRQLLSHDMHWTLPRLTATVFWSTCLNTDRHGQPFNDVIVKMYGMSIHLDNNVVKRLSMSVRVQACAPEYGRGQAGKCPVHVVRSDGSASGAGGRFPPILRTGEALTTQTEKATDQGSIDKIRLTASTSATGEPNGSALFSKV